MKRQLTVACRSQGSNRRTHLELRSRALCQQITAAFTAMQVWPFTDGRYAAQHSTAAFKGPNLVSGLGGEARQVPLIHLLKNITIRHTKEVLDLPDKTVEDVPGGLAACRVSGAAVWCGMNMRWAQDQQCWGCFGSVSSWVRLRG